MNYTLNSADLGDIKDIFKNHYDSIISRLPENEQLPARIFIEDGLIFEEDKRRLSLYEGQILKQYKISKELLQELVNSFIIRAEPYHAGGFMYELCHDTLVEPIIISKKKRNEEEALEKQIKIKNQLSLLKQIEQKRVKFDKTTIAKYFISCLLGMVTLIAFSFLEPIISLVVGALFIIITGAYNGSLRKTIKRLEKNLSEYKLKIEALEREIEIT